MRKKIFFLFLFFPPLFLFPRVEYKFQQSKPLYYSFQIKGDVYLNYPGTNEKMNVFAKGNLKIETVGIEDEIYNLKITPFKTLIKVNEQIIEDIVNIETGISSVISTNFVKMKKNGEIIEVIESNKGILTLSQVLKLLPVFPEKVFTGKKWKQKNPAFNFPGIPMCNLEFNYLYEKKGNFNLIQLSGVQTIKETKKDKDTKITFDGKNNSKGSFIFNENEGEINNFNGNFDIDLNTKFEVLPFPELKGEKPETLTIKIKLNLQVTLSKLIS
ncbi:MAG: hypothetical protein NC827_05280 [Candidatus Omnitrophica bacterium]|nr:hypothetical protein [Candidatus Omnitrophota bacterium]MCM8802702.1 hypothetical protein [Candidatus Omnitrophota bacterium]